MTRHTLSMVLDPCLEFRVERARNGRVSLRVNPVAADDPPYRIELQEGDTWIYTLTLNGNGFGQTNRVEHDGRALPPPAVEQRGIAGHFRRRA